LQLTLRMVCAGGKPTTPLFVTSNRWIAIKNSLGWSAAVFCVCVS
jgi:hypothetical protein